MGGWSDAILCYVERTKTGYCDRSRQWPETAVLTEPDPGGTFMIYTALTKKLWRVAYEAHHGQTDRSGTPDIFHPFHARSRWMMRSVCAALLHDVVEDTEITFEDLEKDFPEEVVEALLFSDKEIRVWIIFDYIRNLRKNPIAKKVKQADLLHNSDVTRLTDCENISLPTDFFAWKI